MARNLSAALGVPAALIAVAAFWLLIARPTIQAAHITTGYVAKTVCSCVFVDLRDLNSCKADLAADHATVGVTLDRESGLVGARAGLISRDRARFDPRYGCRLEER